MIEYHRVDRHGDVESRLKLGTNREFGKDAIVNRIGQHAKKVDSEGWAAQLAMLADRIIDQDHAENDFWWLFCNPTKDAKAARASLFNDHRAFEMPWCQNDMPPQYDASGLSYESQRSYEDIRVLSYEDNPVALSALRRVFDMHNQDVKAGRRSRLVVAASRRYAY